MHVGKWQCNGGGLRGDLVSSRADRERCQADGMLLPP